MSMSNVAERRYVLLLDRERDYIRLFRADCSARPDGRTLWEGDGLYRAYDAMKRLNRERRPAKVWHVCESVSDSPARVFASPPEGWRSVSVHTVFRDARAAAAEARARKAEEKSRRTLDLMRRGGYRGRKVPKLTKADKAYLAWLEKKTRKTDVRA